MADLLVTDVQRILREHAMHGHDILKDPRIVHFGNPSTKTAPFGIPLLHKLYINKDFSGTQLNSTVIHGEKPTGTVVNSWLNLSPSGSSLSHRDATKFHPYYEKGRSDFTSFVLPEQDKPLGEEQFKPQEEHDYFVKMGNGRTEASHDDIHTALHNQFTSPVLYTFHDRDYATRQNDGRWDFEEALSRTSAPLKPFSGLVPVTFGNHVEGTTKYLYDPRTEKLISQ